MKSRNAVRLTVALAVAMGCALAGYLAAQNLPRFTRIQFLTNKEIALTLSVSNGPFHRIDASTNLSSWSGLVTMPGSAGSIQHTDAATPYLSQRFYRAEQLDGTNFLAGDHLATTNGDVVFRSVGHASFVMSWNGKMIYNDPTNGAAPYASFPKADLILVSHDHGDHFSSSTIDAVRGSSAVIVVPPYVYTNNLSSAQRAVAIVLPNGATTNVMGLTVQAVPAYNGNHPLGRGNGYVLTIGGKRIYLSGDTGAIPETRALPNIDVAFVCMNAQFTMHPTQAVSVVRDFRPKVVFPYHYRDFGTVTNAVYFKQQLGTDLGIEVRLRKWY